MNSLRAYVFAFVGLCLTVGPVAPALADEKEGMPDLGQIDETCLPTATANLIIWFGLHGYPRLIASGDSKGNGYRYTLNRLMKDTDANFDWGTDPDKITDGIKEYIEQAGYKCDVDFRGLGKTAFSADWLKENDKPNKGFILLLAYCSHNDGNDTYASAYNAGHAVTLVNAMPDMILIHDPAHYGDEPGRKILTPHVLTSGLWTSHDGNFPVAGLMMLSGSLLDSPNDAQIMLIGAVCVTMHPAQDMIASSSTSSAGSPAPQIGGSAGSSGTPTPAPAPVSATKSWTEWLFSLFFSK